MSIILPDPGPPNLEFERPADRAHLERAATALERRGMHAQVASSGKEARQLVLDAIPEGAEVHIALSETMRELGITAEIDESGRYDSVRSRLSALDRETQAREMRKLGAAPDYIVGSAHAITDGGKSSWAPAPVASSAPTPMQEVTSSWSWVTKSSYAISTKDSVAFASTAFRGNTYACKAWATPAACWRRL